MSPNKDRAGVVIHHGHTVHLGAAVGRVESVHKGYACVHWISGLETTEPCSRLTVQRAVGRVVKHRRGPVGASAYFRVESHLQQRLGEFVS